MRESANNVTTRSRPLLTAVLLLVAQAAASDPWYEHYANAEQALARQQWTLAVQEINEALQKKGDSGARVRSYGMNVTPYFPYLKLGIAYYHLDQFEAALQAFETEARLGAIAQSASASADLEKFRTLVVQAHADARAKAEQRILQIVLQSLDEARERQEQGLLDEAMSSLDRALAVAPENAEAQTAMHELRRRFAEREQRKEQEQRVTKLVADGRALVQERQFSEASSLFRQALYLRPSAEVQELLDAAQDNLLAEIEAGRSFAGQQTSIGAGMEEVRAFESLGQIAAALDRIQSVLALDAQNAEAQTIQSRLLRARREAQAESDRQAAIGQYLAEADAQFRAGSPEAALSAANRALALDSGNSAALGHVARAYGLISRKLLGTAPRENLPPAVRFVDLRLETDDGMPVQTIRRPDFRLNGVIIDDSRVDVVFQDNDGRSIEPSLNSQPLGDFFITEFSVESRLVPGYSLFRLVATDAENLSSSSEYAVLYVQPVYRKLWFYGALFAGVLLVACIPFWQRYRHSEEMRKRKFNPYVAGAPVLEDRMFFGRGELVDRILQTVHNNSLLIYGERRIGKTSIQHQLKRRLLELDDPVYEFHPVYVDLQGTTEHRFFETIAADIFEELSPVLDGLKPGREFSSDYSYRDFVADVRAVLKYLQGKTTRMVKLVLLIDEVDELNEYDPRINQKLRSLFMKNFAENLVAVVSGVEIKKQWEREGSPWYNFFEEIEVKAFDPREARQLIERPIDKVFKLNRGVVERIISLTAGKPYLIQKLCVALVSRMHQQGRRRITLQDVEAVAGPARSEYATLLTEKAVDAF